MAKRSKVLEKVRVTKKLKKSVTKISTKHEASVTEEAKVTEKTQHLEPEATLSQEANSGWRAVHQG